jgi:CRP-like cAMP-binding protein
LSNRDFYLLQAALEPEKVPAGQLLARRGTSIRRFVLIQSGEVEVWQPDPAGKTERLVGELQRGATFGSEVFVGQETQEASYRTSVDTDILTISAAEAARLRQAGVEIDTKVVGALSTAQLLNRMPIFANLSPQQISVLAAGMKSRQVDAGQTIVHQGEPRSYFFVIIDGQVAVSVRDEMGEERVVAHLGRGEHFGETALYADRPYNATCRAETPTKLLTLDEPTFDALVADSRQVAHYVEQVSSGRTLDTRRKLGLEAIVS